MPECSIRSVKIFLALDETVKWFLENYNSGARIGKVPKA